MKVRNRIIAAIALVGISIGVIALRWESLWDERLPAFPYGEVRIGVSASNPPFAYIENGELVGLEIDLGRALAAQLNAPVRFVPIGTDGLYDAIQTDQVDLVISRLVEEPWRTQDAHYTRPYFDAGLVLVSNMLDSMGDLPGHALAYEFGSIADAEARIWSRRVMAFEARPYELSIYALDAARLGEADAALVDAVSAHLYLDEHPTWGAEMHYVTQRQYVIATDFYRGETFAAVDGALAEIIRAGIVDALITRWL